MLAATFTGITVRAPFTTKGISDEYREGYDTNDDARVHTHSLSGDTSYKYTNRYTGPHGQFTGANDPSTFYGAIRIQTLAHDMAAAVSAELRRPHTQFHEG